MTLTNVRGIGVNCLQFAEHSTKAHLCLPQNKSVEKGPQLRQIYTKWNAPTIFQAALHMAPTDWIWIWLDKSNNTLHLILSFIQVIFYNHISVICSFECVCCPLSSVRCKGRKLLTFKLYSLVLTLRLTCQLTTLADKHAKIQIQHQLALVLNFLLWSESRQYNAAILQTYPYFTPPVHFKMAKSTCTGFRSVSMGFRSIRSSLWVR